MNKRVILALIVVLSIYIVGCDIEEDTKPYVDSQITGTFNNEPYELEENIYSNKNVTIHYPQINNLGNQNKQNIINALIKSEALEGFSNKDEDLYLTIDYEIELNNNDVLSIRYFGLGYNKGASYPNNWFFTTNIDIKNEEKIKLSDLIKIDDKFIVTFKEGKYINPQSIDNTPDYELQKAVREYVNSLESNELIQHFNQSDYRSIEKNPFSVFSYFTLDSIVISISVPHALGDHAEYQIDNHDILGHYNDNELSKNLVMRQFD